MATAWKKVFTTANTIGVANGGTGAQTLTDGAVLLGNGTSAIDAVSLGANALLVGVASANPVALTANSSSDVKLANNSDGTYLATIQTDAVTGSMVNDGTLAWTTHESTVGGNALKMPFYAASTGAPALTAAPTTSGQVLQYNGTTIVWGTNTASNLAIDNETAVNKVYNIGFGETSADGTAGLTSGSTDFNVSSNFSINPQPAANQSLLRLRNAGTVPTASGAGDSAAGMIIVADAADPTKNILQISNIYGVATSAKRIQHTAAASGSSYGLAMIGSNASTFNGSGEAIHDDAGLQYSIDSAGVGTLSVENLNVTGTTTTLNTSTLDVNDHSVRIATPATADTTITDSDAAALGELGIVANLDPDAADNQLPRFVYKGLADSTSTIGWKVASAYDDTASTQVNSFGVAVMHRAIGALDATGGSNEMFDPADDDQLVDDPLSIGVGAFAIDSNGDLWLQTAE